MTTVGFRKPYVKLAPTGTPDFAERAEQGLVAGFTQLPRDLLKFWPLAKLFGFWLGLITMTILFCIGLSDQYSKANDMLAIAALVAFWWALEVIHLSATSLMPLVLIPLCSISKSATIAGACWG